MGFHILNGFNVLVAGYWKLDGWGGAVFGIFFTVFGVEGPLAASGLGFVFEEDVAGEALLFVEDGLMEFFFGGFEEGSILFGGVEKEGRVDQTEFNVMCYATRPDALA